MDRFAQLIEILLIEDSKFDIELVYEVFAQSRINNNMNVLTNGDDALDYIYQRPPYAEAARPDIILLDMNLPGKDGREVLRGIRNHPTFVNVPVIVLVGSMAEKEMLARDLPYDTHFIVKPISFASFMAVLQVLGIFGVGLLKPYCTYEPRKYAS